MERDLGFRDEIFKYNNHTNRPHWHEILDNLTALGIDTNYMATMEHYATYNPTAMMIMVQSPMRDPNWTQFVDNNRFRNMTIIGTDGSDYQLAYLNQRYVDGLVGQLPYEIGTEAVKTLHKLVTEGRNSLDNDIISTNVVAYNLIPLELPKLDVNENILENLKYFGLICFAKVAVLVAFFIGWTYVNRKSLVVQSAQPFFLVMIAVGVLILSSSLVPLSFDDGGSGASPKSRTYRVGVCMSVPWLAFIGFTITFSALFSKTWRVNQIFKSKTAFTRIKVSERDVLAPFALLLLCNITILTCWTLLDPLEYVREESEGLDYWNRVIATYGSCRSDHSATYLVPLGIVNLLAVVLSGYQAFRARDIASEFSESKYIGLSVAFMIQAFLTGIPVVVVVKNLPRTYYVVLTLTIYVLSMSVMLLIFLPKAIQHRKYSSMSEREQKVMLNTSLQSVVGGSGKEIGKRSWSVRLNERLSGTTNPSQRSKLSTDSMRANHPNVAGITEVTDKEDSLESLAHQVSTNEHTTAIAGVVDSADVERQAHVRGQATATDADTSTGQLAEHDNDDLQRGNLQELFGRPMESD
jgi:7 transmembrane sweet-taste receptor of 3 GCPR